MNTAQTPQAPAADLRSACSALLEIVEFEFANDPEPEDLPSWKRAIDQGKAALEAAPLTPHRGHKVIRFYRYNGREIVHTSSWADFELILALTGQRFINSAMREMFRDLSGGAISWEEVKP